MRAFYADVLGLAVVREAPAVVTLAGATGAEIVLHEGRPAAACAETHAFVQFLVGDIDASVRELNARGVASAVADRPYGRYARLRDPEGNVVGLEQSRA